MVSLNTPANILTQSFVSILLALHDMCEAGKSNEMMYAAFQVMSSTQQVPGLPAVIHEWELSRVLALMFKQAWFQGDVPAQVWAEKSVALVSKPITALFTSSSSIPLLADPCSL